MRVLGIDPGVATTGWAIVDFDGEVGQKLKVQKYGVILTPKEDSLSQRLVEIKADLDSLIEKYKPDMAGIESLLFYNNAKTAISVGEARGVILLCLQLANVPILECTPPQVKNSVTGYGKADKKQIQENVKLICGLAEIPKPDDAADAIAIAITVNTMRRGMPLT